MAQILKNLYAKKAKQENYIPLKLINKHINLFSSVPSRIFNFFIDKTSFPNSLKQADITTDYKKKTTTKKQRKRHE